MKRRTFAMMWLAPAGLAYSQDGEKKMKTTVDKLMMLSVAVRDMPKAKAFYADALGLKVVNDMRRDERNWWVSLGAAEGPSITLTTVHENMKPGTLKLYFATSDVAAALQELRAKGVETAEVKNDLYGPGSGVKWAQLQDPDGNQVLFVQGAK